MRFLAIGFTAAVLLTLPLYERAVACEGHRVTTQAATVDLSAEEQKKPKKKLAMKKRAKVEYMRAAPMPPGAK